MKAKLISPDQIELYLPKWSEDRTKFGLSLEEQNEQGYKELVSSDLSGITPNEGEYPQCYYEELDGVIYERVRYVKLNQDN